MAAVAGAATAPVYTLDYGDGACATVFDVVTPAPVAVGDTPAALTRRLGSSSSSSNCRAGGVFSAASGATGEPAGTNASGGGGATDVGGAAAADNTLADRFRGLMQRVETRTGLALGVGEGTRAEAARRATLARLVARRAPPAELRAAGFTLHSLLDHAAELAAAAARRVAAPPTPYAALGYTPAALADMGADWADLLALRFDVLAALGSGADRGADSGADERGEAVSLRALHERYHVGPRELRAAGLRMAHVLAARKKGSVLVAVGFRWHDLVAMGLDRATLDALVDRRGWQFERVWYDGLCGGVPGEWAALRAALALTDADLVRIGWHTPFPRAYNNTAASD